MGEATEALHPTKPFRSLQPRANNARGGIGDLFPRRLHAALRVYSPTTHGDAGRGAAPVVCVASRFPPLLALFAAAVLGHPV
jgi:hypothetical protein